jgi:hypothetical protein
MAMVSRYLAAMVTLLPVCSVLLPVAFPYIER